MIKGRLLPYLSSIITDRMNGYVFLAFLGGYLVIFALFRGYEIFSIPLGLGALVILIPIFVTDALKTAIESFSPREYYRGEENLKKVTAVIPTKDGGDTLKPTIESLLKRFNKKHIIVASNGSTDNTCEVARSYGVVLVDIPKAIGKVQAINEALAVVKTPYTLILDDDTLVGQAVIPTSALDKGYDGVAFCVLPVKEGWVSTLQLHEYRKSMDIGRCFHNSTASVQSVSGAIGLFKTEELKRQITLHTGEFSGEDLQRTLLILASSEKKGVVITDSIVETFVPSTLWELFKQRMIGWFPGQYSNLGIYSRLIFAKHVPLKLRWEAFFSVFLVSIFDIFRLMSLPVLLFSPAYMVVFYVTYVALESIPYFVMGRKEPFWVVLVAPFYGLFNFVARLAAAIVFVYRRFSYKIARGQKYDDYRKAKLGAKLLGSLFTFSVVVLIFLGSVYARALPSDIREEVTDTVLSRQTAVELEQAFVEVVTTEIQSQEEITLPESNLDFEFSIEPGDSHWKYARIVSEQYLNENEKIFTSRQKNRMIAHIAYSNSNTKLRPGKIFIISHELVEEAYVKSIN